MLSCLYPSCDPSFFFTAPGGDYCWESLELNSSEASFSLINPDSSNYEYICSAVPLYRILLLKAI